MGICKSTNILDDRYLYKDKKFQRLKSSFFDNTQNDIFNKIINFHKKIFLILPKNEKSKNNK